MTNKTNGRAGWQTGLLSWEGCAMGNALSSFADAIRASGLEPPEVIVPGKLHRFPGRGKGNSNRAGWCMLFEDCLGGCFGDWSSGVTEYWLGRQGKTHTLGEGVVLLHRVAEARKPAISVRNARQADAAKRAVAIWNAATPAPSDHPYLLCKRIKPHRSRLYKGALTLLIEDFAGKPSSLQFIAADGNKRLLSGGRKQGCFIHVAGEAQCPVRVIICEGWATGCTLSEDDPTALILAAIDAGNLEPVALAARRRWPTVELVIAGDDDRLTRGNPGGTKAKAAALASGALLALPRWPKTAPEHLTDFNDLAVWLAGGYV